MKKIIVGGLMFGAFMLVSTGSPLQLLSIDSVQPAYALEASRDPAPIGGHGDGDHRDKKGPKGHGPVNRVPEPTTLALLAAGGAGIGIFGFLRRRNRK